MSISNSPLRYPGGKSQFYNQVVNILKENKIQHATYIEPFAGGAGVAIRLLLDGMVDSIVINDIDAAIYAFWHTVVFENKWLIEKIKNTQITIDEWNVQKAIYLAPNDHPIRELGFATLFLNRCNRSGILSAGPIGGKNQSGNYKIDCRFNKDNLITLIRRIGFFKNRIKIYNYDASVLIKKLRDIANAFWFIDPPYYIKGAELYKNSFNSDDHKALSTVINKYLSKQSWILTYDVHDEIYNLYKHYQHELITLTYTIEKKKRENEYLFFNNLIVRKEMLL